MRTPEQRSASARKGLVTRRRSEQHAALATQIVRNLTPIKISLWLKQGDL